ncbi:hypothetical protein [Sinosporangium siamense]|uniref:hypothetical protein n=1 Tax=Sinosporangium siamense TaxID=1367973 RepID=UPI00194E31D2|nr:hypothetical protein [Sinosporangium siamense]
MAVLVLENGINVWVDDMGVYRWWNGQIDTTGRHVYAVCPWAVPDTVARQIWSRTGQQSHRASAAAGALP